jgi:hypothetical protein
MMMDMLNTCANQVSDNVDALEHLSSSSGACTTHIELMQLQYNGAVAIRDTIANNAVAVRNNVVRRCNEIKALAIKEKRTLCMGNINSADRAVTRAQRDILRAKNEAAKWAVMRRQQADQVSLLQREYNMLTTLKAQADSPCTYHNYRYSPTQNGVVDPILSFGGLGWAYYDATAFKYHIMYDSNCDYVYAK